jgi:U6 snRNA-associated Sm-like protein LSm8
MPGGESAPRGSRGVSRGGRGGASGGGAGGRDAGRAGGGGGGSSGGAGSSLLVEFLDKRVGVVTNDGRMIVGRLRGFDQVCNVVLDSCVERIFSPDVGVESAEYGVQVVRGDNMCVLLSLSLYLSLSVYLAYFTFPSALLIATVDKCADVSSYCVFSLLQRCRR